MKITTIVFDIGQVLVEFHWREYIKTLGFDDKINEALGEATVLSRWWPEVDLGMKEAEYITHMKEDHPELSNQIDEFWKDTAGLFTTYSYSEPLLKQLKQQGYRIYLLSNFGDTLFHRGVVKMPFRKYVDGEVISYQVKHVKPEPEIYEALCQWCNVNPEEAVFLDDVQANIDAATRAGFHGICFQNLEQALEELEKLGVTLEQPILLK